MIIKIPCPLIFSWNVSPRTHQGLGSMALRFYVNYMYKLIKLSSTSQAHKRCWYGTNNAANTCTCILLKQYTMQHKQDNHSEIRNRNKWRMAWDSAVRPSTTRRSLSAQTGARISCHLKRPKINQSSIQRTFWGRKVCIFC